jgi:nitrile hydratase accessory protein
MPDPLPPSGPGAPPRDNGELVFDQPWQTRAFAVTVSLFEDGAFAWDEFRDRLIEGLDDATDAAPATYWAAWLRATEQVLAARGVLDGADHRTRLAHAAARPPGHDHDHDHDHGHGHGHDH